ncbi:MAG: aminotransferase class IV family protein [Pseudomonadota bacterium]
MESPLRPPADPGFELIETFLWTPGQGVVRQARHLDRLRRTAEQFDISLPDVDAQIDALSSPGPLRVRLSVGMDGDVTLTHRPFQPLATGTIWRLGLSEHRLRADDPWLTVKTTQRQLYDAARASLPADLDELLFLNENDWLCEGTITNVFVDLGEGLLTPPLSCGVLPGVLRQELIESGRAREAHLKVASLSDCHALYVGNSLRGLIPARMSKRHTNVAA